MAKLTEAQYSCVFCQIADGSAAGSIVFRNKLCMAFMDLHPINVGHVLICPIRHVVSFTDLNANETQSILCVAQRIVRTQKDALPNCSGVNLILSDGEAAGQEVLHAHFHLVPRQKGDGFGWRRLGRRSSREQLDAMAEKLRIP